MSGLGGVEGPSPYPKQPSFEPVDKPEVSKASVLKAKIIKLGRRLNTYDRHLKRKELKPSDNRRPFEVIRGLMDLDPAKTPVPKRTVVVNDQARHVLSHTLEDLHRHQRIRADEAFRQMMTKPRPRPPRRSKRGRIGAYPSQRPTARRPSMPPDTSMLRNPSPDRKKLLSYWFSRLYNDHLEDISEEVLGQERPVWACKIMQELAPAVGRLQAKEAIRAAKEVYPFVMLSLYLQPEAKIPSKEAQEDALVKDLTQFKAEYQYHFQGLYSADARDQLELEVNAWLPFIADSLKEIWEFRRAQDAA